MTGARVRVHPGSGSIASAAGPPQVPARRAAGMVALGRRRPPTAAPAGLGAGRGPGQLS